MRSPEDRQLLIVYLYRSLIVCLIVLVLIIIGGTVYGLFFNTIPPANNQNTRINVPAEGGQGQTFTGIGRIRVSTADPQPGIVVLFVSFIYYPEDKSFTEELALRVRDFRGIITDYIGSFSTAELQGQSEEDIKTELLRRFNAILRLGQIETLYFSDFIVVR